MDKDYNVGELFERYSDMIYRIAISYGNNVQMAEDVVQEVFLRVLRKKPHFENWQHEKAWLIRVSVNCCKSMLSSAWLKNTLPLEDAGQIVLSFDREEESELFETLSLLPAKYRLVLYLRYYEGYQVKEIAGILHLMPNTVSARLTRARKMLKQEVLNEMEGKWNEGSLI